MFRRLSATIVLFALCLATNVNGAGLREYYYFFTTETTREIQVMRIDEEGNVLEQPNILRGPSDIQGLTVSRNSSGQYVLITMQENTHRLRRWIFVPPGSVTDGETIADTSPYDFNLDATGTLPGVIVGSSEGFSRTSYPAIGLSITSIGSSPSDFYNAFNRTGSIVFASIRRDGSEAVAASLCCGNPQLLLQRFKPDFTPHQDPIVVAQTSNSFTPHAVRISDNGSFLVAATGNTGGGILLYKLDSVTRQSTGDPDFLRTGDLRYYDSTQINENASFCIFTTKAGPGNICFVRTDGKGHFVGSPKKLATVGQYSNYSSMIRAN
jgi:hypothetical protein